ncbi:MAG: hypothetical protein WCK92_14880 [Bacteroidota bacterium]
MNTIERVLSFDNAGDFPQTPAFYRIYCVDPLTGYRSNCRFEGSALNLRDSLLVHFSLHEKDIPLRYFMLSCKEKLIEYIPMDDLDSAASLQTREEWVRKAPLKLQNCRV